MKKSSDLVKKIFDKMCTYFKKHALIFLEYDELAPPPTLNLGSATDNEIFLIVPRKVAKRITEELWRIF